MIMSTAERVSSPQSGTWDVLVWNTATGQLISAQRNPYTDLHDVSISKDGKWILTANLGIDIYNPSQQYGGYGYGFSGIGITQDVVTVTFDAAGRLLAYGIRNEHFVTQSTSGEVGLLEWNGSELKKPVVNDLGFTKLYLAEHKLKSVPLRLAFDPASRLLAVQTDNSVQLLNVPSLAEIATRVGLPDTSFGTLTFNPSGSLLTVGHSQGMKVLGVPGLSMVLDRPGAQVTAIAFSSDGCLLAWGDVEGNVHVINAPKP